MERLGHNRWINEINSSARDNKLEFVAQVILMMGTGILAWVATGLSLIPIWLAVHYAMVVVERYEMRRHRDRGSKIAVAWILFLQLMIGITFAFMPVYLWLQDREGYHFAGMALLMGSTLNTFLVRSRFWYQALPFVVPNSVAISVIAVSIGRQSPTFAEGVTVICVATAIVAYFAVAVVQASRAHRRHVETREQLAQAQKMEALGNLAGGMAHDFNNILNVITGTIELVRGEQDVALVQKRLEQANVAAERGAELIRQVLAFARKSHLRPNRIDPPSVMTEVEHMTRRMISERVDLRFQCAPTLPPIRADKGALVTALLNLVLNARDAIEGSGQITVSCRVEPCPSAKNDHQVVFSILDTGRGIPAELIGRVTEPFFTTKRTGEGSGLGLSMVAGFAAQSGGAFHIESDVGTGTRARICLPIDTRTATVETTVPEVALQATTSHSILVVEDQRELLELLVMYLKRSGHSVTAAKSGDEALEMLGRGLRPELVISDMVMPGKAQGRDLAAFLGERLPEVRVVLISGFDEAEFAGTFQKSSQVAFLTKPVRLSELAEQVSKLRTNDQTVS